MSDLLKRLWTSILPVISMVVFVALFILGLFVSFYLLIFAAIIGLILSIVAFIRSKFIGPKAAPPDQPTQGRTIEYDEVEKKDDSKNDGPSSRH